MKDMLWLLTIMLQAHRIVLADEEDSQVLKLTVSLLQFRELLHAPVIPELLADHRMRPAEGAKLLIGLLQCCANPSSLFQQLKHDYAQHVNQYGKRVQDTCLVDSEAGCLCLVSWGVPSVRLLSG